MTPQHILTHWNSKQGKRWRKCRKLSPILDKAIRKRLKLLGDDLLGSIDNYHTVLTSHDYAWTYTWSLFLFLTRHKPGEKREDDYLQCVIFSPDVFVAENYLTADAKRRAVMGKQKKTMFVPISFEEGKKRRADMLRKKMNA